MIQVAKGVNSETSCYWLLGAATSYVAKNTSGATMPRKSAAYYNTHPNNKYWKTKAIALWREAVIRRWGDRCIVCGNPNVQCHHGLTKGAHPEYIVNVYNGFPLCYAHHRGKGKPSAHTSPYAFAEWLAEHFPWRWKWIQKISG